MKLVYAIVNNDDSHAVQMALTKSGFQATKIASSGGFLLSGNTTFMICAQDNDVEEILSIIREHSHKRRQLLPNSASFSNYSGGNISADLPVEVTVGGATIFVTDIEHFEKV